MIYYESKGVYCQGRGFVYNVSQYLNFTSEYATGGIGMKARGGLSLDLLKISIGIFFVLLGFFGILRDVEESVFSLIPGQGYGFLEILFGIVELVCGIIIILGMFTFLPKRVKVVSSLLILIFWCARIIVSKIVFELAYMSSFGYFTQWLLVLAAQLVIAAALWIFYRNSDL
jgi:hypothetical protein